MKRLPIAIALAMALLAAGCRSGGQQELLERELRWQEDRIGHLESHLDQCEQQLAASERENEELKRRLPLGGSQLQLGGSPPAAVRTREEPSPVDLVPPTVDLPGMEQAPPFQTPPEISPPNPTVPEGQMPPGRAPALQPPAGSAVAPQSDSPASSGPLIEPKFIPSADGGDPGRVTQITLNSARTAGYNADDQPGDEGVSVLVEPRDAKGELLRVAGKLSIVVIDPGLAGDAARIARWNFTEEESASHHRQGTDGLWFDLRWPEQLPQKSNLKLYVRFTRPDGRKFDVEQDLRIAPPPRSTAEWTRSTHPAPPKTSTIETTPLAPAAAPAGDSSPPASQPPAAASDRTVSRTGVQWTPYR